VAKAAIPPEQYQLLTRLAVELLWLPPVMQESSDRIGV
jgi:hypothetical protein